MDTHREEAMWRRRRRGSDVAMNHQLEPPKSWRQRGRSLPKENSRGGSVAPADALISDFQSPDCEKTRFHCLNPPVRDDLLQHPWETNTGSQSPRL